MCELLLGLGWFVLIVWIGCAMRGQSRLFILFLGFVWTVWIVSLQMFILILGFVWTVLIVCIVLIVWIGFWKILDILDCLYCFLDWVGLFVVFKMWICFGLLDSLDCVYYFLDMFGLFGLSVLF